VGNLPGLVAAGVVLGVAGSIAGFYSSVWQQALPMILVALVYAVRPEGIFARVRVRRV
jgi:branched-subunit amino acid ABC-type transport system permease component